MSKIKKNMKINNNHSNYCVEESTHLGFVTSLSSINNDIFVPSYYNPETKSALKRISDNSDYKLVTVSELLDNQLISIKRGNEVGSQFYGLGDIPFVRTSDIVNWEVKHDPIKSLPEEIYNKYNKSQDIRENDILIVSDGTFLIGRCAMITSADRKIVIQSHIKRIRCLQFEKLHPYVLLYMLSTDIVQKQISEKTFVQATISTLGDRLLELVLPFPCNKEIYNSIYSEVSVIISNKVSAKNSIERLLSKSL